jgi:hypothetical protein
VENYQNEEMKYMTRTSGFIKKKLEYSDNPILNEIINDVLKVTSKYENEIITEKKEDIKQILFKIVRVFTLYRPDITYSQQITLISLVLLLNTENYYTAFVALVNFVVPSLIMKFLTRDENYVK